MGSSDSLSLPSEQRDIGNWFSSYVYESPELNTIEDFQDSADSIIAETVDSPNETKQNFDGITILARNNDLALDGMGVSDIKSPPRDDTSNSMGDGLKYSGSFSLGSEPLDVKKWFSSYMYESPVVDTNWAFTSNEKESDAKCGSREQEVSLSNSTRNDKDNDSENENTQPDGSVECTNFHEDTKKNENTCISEDQGYKSFVIDGSSVDKYSNEFNPGVSDGWLSITSDSQERRLKSKLVHPKLDIKKESWRTEDDSMKGIETSVCAENTETIINQADAKPMKKTLGDFDADKKKNPEFSSQTGFISTKRKIKTRRRVNNENSDHANNRIHISRCSNEEIIKGRRKVLSETTTNLNHQSCNRTEVTGKWKCPQKSKPNLGPPLKQLRLGQWLRRV